MCVAVDQRAMGRWQTLRWLNPTLLPHGVHGLAFLLLGLYLNACTFSGSLAVYEPDQDSWFFRGRFALLLYLLTGSANALSGVVLAGRSGGWVNQAFRDASIMQLSVFYFMGRFSEPQANPPVDVVMCSVFLYALLSMMLMSFKQDAVTNVAVCCGCVGLSLLGVYPLQIAWGGDAWWACVQRDYPLQSEAMVAYIFVPTTWTFAVMLFGATLFRRKIISPTMFGVTCIALIVGCVCLAVILQEAHAHEVSTQMLYIPCPDSTPWQRELASCLNLSPVAYHIAIALGLVDLSALT